MTKTNNIKTFTDRLGTESLIYELRTNPEVLKEFYNEAVSCEPCDVAFINTAYNYISTVDDDMANDLILNADKRTVMAWADSTDVMSALPNTQVYFYKKLGKAVIPLIKTVLSHPLVSEIITKKDRGAFSLILKHKDIINKFDLDLLIAAFEKGYFQKAFLWFKDLAWYNKILVGLIALAIGAGFIVFEVFK